MNEETNKINTADKTNTTDKTDTKSENGLSKFIKRLKAKMEVNSKISDRQKKIKQEQKLIIDQYQLIGEKVYALFVEGADVGETFEGYCSSVKESMGKIAEYRNNINEFNEIKTKL